MRDERYLAASLLPWMALPPALLKHCEMGSETAGGDSAWKVCDYFHGHEVKLLKPPDSLADLQVELHSNYDHQVDLWNLQLHQREPQTASAPSRYN